MDDIMTFSKEIHNAGNQGAKFALQCKQGVHHYRKHTIQCMILQHAYSRGPSISWL